MPLTAGTRLGPYEIVAPLGAGGMGEVYRAKDTRLGRDVAVKVLPQHLSANPEVRARFEREAKTVSSLNHPNICTLFDVGREGDTDYLVMELVEGETLAQRLAKGFLPGPEVLKLGAQIANALDRAHRAGVIHRDLKPANVMLTKSGAKLMDFGLARATGMSGPAAGSGLTQSPTAAQPLTAEGTIVGTIQYMAPEQLEGKEADERSDLWALGCVLYEMATGRRAFEGKSQASLISSIMKDEPPPVSQIAPLMPAGLGRLVSTCLTKDPDERARTAHDVKLQLQGLSEGGSQSGAHAVAAVGPPRHWLPWIFAGLLGLAAVTLGIALVGRGRVSLDAVRFMMPPPEQMQFGVYASGATISPDGKSVAFSATDSSRRFSLWVQSLDSPHPVRLASLQRNTLIFWSPDSRNIGYLDIASSSLATIPVTGGTPSMLCAAPSARGGTWNARGVILFAPNAQGPLFRISANGGEPVQETRLDSTRHEAGHRFPCFLPDGEHFLYVSLPPGPQGFDVYVGALGSRTTKKLMVASSAPIYAEPGYLLYRHLGKLMVQPFDARRLRITGEAVALADAAPPSELDGEPVASASQNGRLAFVDSHEPNLQISWFDRSSVPSGLVTLPAGRWAAPVLSPDDRFAVVRNGFDLWRVDLARSIAVRLTSNGYLNTDPVWSPDGTKLAFTENRSGSEEIYIMNSDGSGEPQLLPTTTDLFKHPESWVGGYLTFTNITATTFRDLWSIRVPGGEPPEPLMRSRFGEYLSAVSPDGRWIAYVSNEAGAEDLYVQTFPVPGHKIRLSAGGAGQPFWMPGSDEVCYTSQGYMMSMKLLRQGDDLRVGEPQKLFQLPPGVRGLSMTHDGRRMLASIPLAGSDDRHLRIVLDWPSLAKR